jgi:uncharacterized protein (DUF1800 family)
VKPILAAIATVLICGSTLLRGADNRTDLSKQELADASRFLSQATLGADIRLIREVAEVGPETWLLAQFDAPIGLHLPTVEFYIENVGGLEQDIISLGLYPRLAWWQQAMAGPDPLRQRIALALSEIFVISERQDTLFINPSGRAAYYDMLLGNAFGNYRDLLMDVTRHPTMGVYLSHLNNRRSDVTFNRFPDENFAREAMQLFSIGLFELNTDGSRKLDVDGLPIPTYDNGDITEFAKVFTGLGPGGVHDSFGDEVFFDFTVPMRMYSQWHEPGEKHLLRGLTVPAGQSALQDVEDAVDNLFEHPNVGPFFARLLIQRLVTSNPTSEYIGRVAAAFNDNGEGVRGDMKTVIRAILFDPEASGGGLHFGRLQEPFVRYVALARMFRAASQSGRYINSGFFGDFFLNQHAGASPSVFNFFLPDHQPNGEIAEAGLVAPEFQISTDSTLIGMANLAFGVTIVGLPMDNPLGEQLAACAAGLFTCDHIPAWLRDEFGVNIVHLDFSEEIAVADDVDALLDHLDILMTYGTLSQSSRDALKPLLVPLDDPDFRVRVAVGLMMVTPDYVVAN